MSRGREGYWNLANIRAIIPVVVEQALAPQHRLYACSSCTFVRRG